MLGDFTKENVLRHYEYTLDSDIRVINQSEDLKMFDFRYDQTVGKIDFVYHLGVIDVNRWSGDLNLLLEQTYNCKRRLERRGESQDER